MPKNIEQRLVFVNVRGLSPLEATHFIPNPRPLQMRVEPRLSFDFDPRGIIHGPRHDGGQRLSVRRPSGPPLLMNSAAAASRMTVKKGTDG